MTKTLLFNVLFLYLFLHCIAGDFLNGFQSLMFSQNKKSNINSSGTCRGTGQLEDLFISNFISMTFLCVHLQPTPLSSHRNSHRRRSSASSPASPVPPWRPVSPPSPPTSPWRRCPGWWGRAPPPPGRRPGEPGSWCWTRWCSQHRTDSPVFN